MSKAELHFIRARLLGGKINKAKKGELRIHIPVGFCYDDEGNIRFDDNEQVRSVIQLLFRVFKEKGSAYGVVDYFSINKIQFPKRVYGGNWKGKLLWGDLRFSRVYEALRNPSYAGAYVYGRFRHQKRLLSTGQVQKIAVRLPMEAWHTMIKDHHEGYITWEEYIANQKILANNRTNREENTLPTAVREGLGLLQGLLICGCCGRRMNVKYKGKNGVVYRGQTREKWGAGKKNCSPIPGNPLEIAIVKRVLEIMEPAQIEIAVKAFEELEQRGHMLDRQWQMQIKRADYEVQLAQRRYEEVDPSNRLVAATLEKRWNEALIALEEAQRQYDEYRKKDVLIATKQQKEQVLALAQDLPHLWNAESTSARDRKRILRLLIKDITVERLRNEQKAVLHIRWQTNATEDLEVQLPQKICDRWRHSEDIIDRIRQLSTTMTDEQIVNLLNQEGLITNKGNPFTISGMQGIRYKHKIPALCNQKSEEELSVKQVAKKFNVSHDIVRCWIKRKFVDARRIGPKFWISISLAQELELKKYIENSSKITTARLKSQQLIE